MSSVTAIPSPTAVYREEQLFGWWAYALMAGMVAIAFLLLTHHPEGRGTAATLGIVVGLALPAVFLLGVLRMTTEVTGPIIAVWFGWIPTYRRSVAIDAIERVEVVTYRPFADFGGWGVLSGKDGERALIARGNRGVRLHMTGGGKLLIGSQRPEVLASAIEQTIRPSR